MDALVRDLRYAGRMLVREPGFTLLALLALALGIGATTAIFTVVDAVLLRPLPYASADRLVVVLHGPEASSPVSPADFADYRGNARSFERLSAAQAWSATIGGGERPERVSGLQVGADLFDLLGVPPLAGRTFVTGDDEPGRERVVVLGHGLWQRRFGANPSVVGRAIQLDGQPYVVVGVMPPGFRFAPFWQTRAEMWVPLSLAPRRDDRAGRSLRLFGRLKDGVSVQQAQAEMTRIAAELERAYPGSNAGLGITVRPLLDKVVSGIRGTLIALLIMVTFVLLIACANVANTLLARASGRQREIAVRTALGAGRARVMRQLLTESLLLACAGAAVGLVFAVWGINWLLALLPPGSLPRQQEVGLDVRVFGIAALAALVSGLTTGLVPAIQLARTSISSAFQDGAKGATEGSGRKRMRSVLVDRRSDARPGAPRWCRPDGPHDAEVERRRPWVSSRSPGDRQRVARRNAVRRPRRARTDVSTRPRSSRESPRCLRCERHQPPAARRRYLDPGLHDRRTAGTCAERTPVGRLPDRAARLLRGDGDAARRDGISRAPTAPPRRTSPSSTRRWPIAAGRERVRSAGASGFRA